MRSSLSHLVSGFAGGALVLVGCVLTSTQRASDPRSADPSVITASEIRLLDAEGRLRVRLTSGADNPPDGSRIDFYDEGGISLCKLGLREGNLPDLVMHRPQGKLGLMLGVDEREEPSLDLITPNGSAPVSIRVVNEASGDGSGLIVLHDAKGNRRLIGPSTN